MFSHRQLAFVLLAVAAACCPVSAGEWLKDLDAAKAEAQRLNRPILLHFYATWCGPCMKMEKNVLNTQPVLDQIETSVVAVKINIDEHKDLANRFDVSQFPTDIFIEPNGTHLIKSTGQKTIDEYARSIARASTTYTDLVAKRSEPKVEPDTKLAGENGNPPVVAKASQEVMLRGYCPVTLWTRRKWEKGSPQFQVEHHGQVYHMASAEDLKKFEQNPSRYAPQLLGCDPVVVYESNRAVPGSTRYGAFYDDELYLFTTDANRKLFKAQPDRFVRDKVVLDVSQIETVVR